MKTKPLLASFLAVALLMTGCVVSSIFPFYTKKDLFFDPVLLGSWVEAGVTNDTGKGWHFEKADGKRYVLTTIDGGTNRYDAHLFRLKKHTFLDLCTTNRAEDQMPVHYVLKVSRMAPTLQLDNLDYGWLEKLSEKHPGAIRHMDYDNNDPAETNTMVVLTADTKDLQKFILKHADDKEAFQHYLEMKHL